jgi:hypothetical protein
VAQQPFRRRRKGGPPRRVGDERQPPAHPPRQAQGVVGAGPPRQPRRPHLREIYRPAEGSYPPRGGAVQRRTARARPHPQPRDHRRQPRQALRRPLNGGEHPRVGGEQEGRRHDSEPHPVEPQHAGPAHRRRPAPGQRQQQRQHRQARPQPEPARPPAPQQRDQQREQRQHHRPQAEDEDPRAPPGGRAGGDVGRRGGRVGAVRLHASRPGRRVLLDPGAEGGSADRAAHRPAQVRRPQTQRLLTAGAGAGHEHGRRPVRGSRAGKGNAGE